MDVDSDKKFINEIEKPSFQKFDSMEHVLNQISKQQNIKENEKKKE